jgi:hypothetical protein
MARANQPDAANPRLRCCSIAAVSGAGSLIRDVSCGLAYGEFNARSVRFERWGVAFAVACAPYRVYRYSHERQPA